MERSACTRVTRDSPADAGLDVAPKIRSNMEMPDGLEKSAATDMLLALAGPGLYTPLVVKYGWPHDAFIGWRARRPIREPALAAPISAA